MNLPLEGLLVADFSRVLAGPLAATMLADLGATVIKVERPQVGDETRQWGPPWADNSSSYFEAANRSKKSIELDLSDPEDLQLAQELARRADVLLENYRDGSLARRGLGYDQVAAEPHHVEQDATDPVHGSAAAGRAQPRRPPMADSRDRPMSTTTLSACARGMIMACSCRGIRRRPTGLGESSDAVAADSVLRDAPGFDTGRIPILLCE
jgi:CoA-transferase family III